MLKNGSYLAKCDEVRHKAYDAAQCRQHALRSIHDARTATSGDMDYRDNDYWLLHIIIAPTWRSGARGCGTGDNIFSKTHTGVVFLWKRQVPAANPSTSSAQMPIR
jgi:hypothetical protein